MSFKVVGMSASQVQWKRFLSTYSSIKLRPDSVDTVVQTVLDWTNGMDGALRQLATPIFNILHNLLQNSPLYSWKGKELEDLQEITKCKLRNDILHLIFLYVPSFTTYQQGVKRFWPPGRKWSRGMKRECRDEDGWSVSKLHYRMKNVPSRFSTLLPAQSHLYHCVHGKQKLSLPMSTAATRKEALSNHPSPQPGCKRDRTKTSWLPLNQSSICMKCSSRRCSLRWGSLG